MFDVKIYQSGEIGKYIPQIAALRIKVFHEYPYLYEGDIFYEEKYLQRYANAKNSFLALAFDGERIIGASTANDMRDEMEEIQKPFKENNYDVNDFYYFAESVLLPEYRGQGIGKIFMQKRAEFAVSLGRKYAAFCSVIREAKPPKSYNSPELLWQKMGFTKHPELVSHFSWKDIGDDIETKKPLVYWLKSL